YEVLYFHKSVIGMEWLFASLVRRLTDLFRQDKLKADSPSVIEPLIEMLQGKPVPIDRLLQVDDYAMWVLIRQITENPKMVGNDATAVNLANRFIERDPLRSVQLPEQKIADFLALGDDSHAKIKQAI